MHKYRVIAREAAWYNEHTDTHPNYNPFRKTRSTPYEDDPLVIHRAQPLQVFASPSTSNLGGEDSADYGTELLEVEGLEHANAVQIPAERTSELEGIPGSLDEENGIPVPSRALNSWKSWSQRKWSYLWRQMVLSSGYRLSGDVKRSVAGTGLSVISHAPLGTKGALVFQGAGRRRRFMVVEYARQGDATKGTQGLAYIT